MHRCGTAIFLFLVTVFALALTGCLGKSSTNPENGGVSSITLSPTGTISLDVGSTRVFSATARNAGGGAILGLDIQYIVQSGTPNASAPLSIATNGNACAGTWDVSVAICSPGTPGIAIVTAVANGIQSQPTTVYIHQHIDSIQIQNAEAQPPLYNCFSQGQTWTYTALAFSNHVNITNTVGPMTWSSTNVGVVTTTPIITGTSDNPVYQVQTTAKAPGVTQLFASVSGTTSAPFQYTTCLIQAVYLQIGGQSQAGNSITVTSGATIPITAIAVDSLCGVANNSPLAAPPLTWSSTDPEIATFSAATNATSSNSAATRKNLGGANLTASCSPPSCNIGVIPSLPIYASNYDSSVGGTQCHPPNLTKAYGAISVNVTGSTTTAAPTYTAWAATTQCADAPGCTSALFLVTPGATPIGAIATLPRTPNSMMFNPPGGTRLYIGSDQGLMYVDATSTAPSATLISNSQTPCNVSLCGKVLAISNDGNMVAISDTVSAPSQVYIYNAASSTGSAPVDLIVPGDTATAAAFSLDGSKLFILTSTGKMYIYSTSDALTSIPMASSATDIKFSADGSFAYVAGNPAGSVSAFSTCSLPNVGSEEIGSVTASSTPLQIFPSPVLQANSLGLTQNIIALEPPRIEILTADNFTQVPIPYQNPLQLTCNPPTIQSFNKGPSYDLGQGAFTPLYTQLVADGTEVIIVAKNVPAVLVFDVSNGSTTSVPLANGADPIAASASSDGSQVFVAACDQHDSQTGDCSVASIHIVSTTGPGDYQQVPYVNASNNNDRNMCNNGGNPVPQCFPDLVAIRPQ